MRTTAHTGLGSYQLHPKGELDTDRASLFGAHEGSDASVSGEKGLSAC